MDSKLIYMSSNQAKIHQTYTESHIAHHYCIPYSDFHIFNIIRDERGTNIDHFLGLAIK